MKTNTSRFMVGASALAVALAGGCKKDGEKKEEAAKTTTDTGEDKPAPEPEKAKPIGIEDPSNDANVVKVVKQLLADCGALMDQSTENSYKPNQKKSLYSCEKWQAFRDAEFKGGEATFVNFLDDPDVKVRAIGVYGLDKTWDWQNNKDLAARVVAGLKKEKAPSPIDHSWALEVKDISTSVGLDDQIKAIAVDPATSNDVRLALLAWWRGPAAYEAVKANAGATDPETINAVVQGYVNHFEEHTEEACAYWVDHLETASKDANRYALGHMTGGWGGNTTGDSESEDYISGGGGGPGSSETKRCSPEQLTKALELIDKRFAAGESESELTYALAFLAKDKLTPEPVKAKTVDILKRMTEQKGYWSRSTALNALVDSGDPKMKKYAQQFKKDEELKDTVAEINKPAQ
jgi:hypothetical protein